jgi:membrane protein implicated in regulation of membrane protease activity
MARPPRWSRSTSRELLGFGTEDEKQGRPGDAVRRGCLSLEGIAVKDAFANLNSFEVFFLACAVVGGFFVVVRLIVQFVGADTELDTDVDLDVHHVDADVGFKLLSMHGLTAFLMMFGLVGFALYRQNQAGFVLSMAGGTVAGLASVWIIGRLFSLITGLQSSGTVGIERAVGGEGTVYLTIPAGGTGRVLITADHRRRELDAVAQGGGEIATGERVRVVAAHGGAVVVERLG